MAFGRLNVGRFVCCSLQKMFCILLFLLSAVTELLLLSVTLTPVITSWDSCTCFAVMKSQKLPFNKFLSIDKWKMINNLTKLSALTSYISN